MTTQAARPRPSLAPRTELEGLAELAEIDPYDHEHCLAAIIRIAATIRAEDAFWEQHHRAEAAVAKAGMSLKA